MIGALAARNNLRVKNARQPAPKTLARPSIELTRILKALTSGSLITVLFVTRKGR